MTTTTLSLFPKFLRSLALDELGPRLRDVGLRAVNLLIRDGYWVEAATVETAIPRFVAAMRAAGLAVPFCTLGSLPEQILADPTPLRVMADNGVRGFRLGYYRRQADLPLSRQLRTANEDLRRLLPLLEELDLRAVYQVHHGTLVSSPSLASLLTEDLPERIGVMLDAGNQGYEGREDWERAARLLGPRWSALGVKDTRIIRRDDGVPERHFCACQEGDNDWMAIAAAFATAGGAGRDPWVLQPFYHETDPGAHLALLTEEVAFVRRAMDIAGLEEP